MKKALIILLGCCVLAAGAQDNTSAMLKQIALLQVYAGYLEKGYDIARKGLKVISDTKDGHWKMDIDFFNSMKEVNPKILHYLKVEAILQQQAQIVQITGSLRKQRFNADEITYINSVCDHILSDCEMMTDRLETILKDDQLTMSDDEPISAIDFISEELKDKSSFIRDFAEQAQLFLRSRVKDKHDIDLSKLLHGL